MADKLLDHLHSQKEPFTTTELEALFPDIKLDECLQQLLDKKEIISHNISPDTTVFTVLHDGFVRSTPVTRNITIN